MKVCPQEEQPTLRCSRHFWPSKLNIPFPCSLFFYKKRGFAHRSSPFLIPSLVLNLNVPFPFQKTSRLYYSRPLRHFRFINKSISSSSYVFEYLRNIISSSRWLPTSFVFWLSRLATTSPSTSTPWWGYSRPQGLDRGFDGLGKTPMPAEPSTTRP